MQLRGLPSGAPWICAVVDLAHPVADLETGGATRAFVTALSAGRLLGSSTLPVPMDPFPGRFLAEALRTRYASALLTVDLEQSVFAGGDRWSDRTPPDLTTTVVVSTRDRPDDLERCLASISRLQVPADEVIVVDNASSDDRTERVARSAGVRYLHEPLPGLNRARNRGLAVATGDVVLFTDDDVQVHPRWLAELLRVFVDPMTMLATGLVLPAVLDTDARLQFELHAGFNRGFERRDFDGTRVSPYVAGAMGAGASMAVRRDCALWLDAFVEELGPGMPTGSGCDTLFFSEVLRAGFRGVYTPSALAFHTHRSTEDALRTTLRGYGNGGASFLLAAARRHRDPTAISVGGRLMAHYLGGKVVRAALGKSGAAPLGLALEEARGVLDAPGGLAKARRITEARAPVPMPEVERPRLFAVPTPAAVRVGEELPTLSVVIPSRGRRDQVCALLTELDGQEYPSDRVEYVVALDGDVDGSAAALAHRVGPRPLRVVQLDAPTNDPHVGNGAATARNRGAAVATGSVLVFLDDDVIPRHPRVLLAHARRHARPDEPRATVGPCAPDVDTGDGLFAMKVRSWWVDHTDRLLTERPLRCWDLCTGNVSLPRATFAELGGFAPMARREDWEFGHRIDRTGITIEAEAGAAVRQVTETRMSVALADRFAEGRGDVVFAVRHPEIVAWSSLAYWDDMPPRHRRAARWAMRHPEHRHAVNAAAVRACTAAEAAGLPRRFEQVLATATLVTYWAGVGEETGGERGWIELRRRARESEGPRPHLDLESAHAWEPPPPGSCAEIVVAFRGEQLMALPVRRGGMPWSRRRFLAHTVDACAGFVGYHRAMPSALADLALVSA
jgi:glycosyltransferase involved in cell wall biosynthesis